MRKIDFANLNEIKPDPVLCEILTGAGYIGTCLRLLPNDQRIQIEQQLVEGLTDDNNFLPDGAKTLIEATAKASRDPAFLAWIFSYVRMMNKAPGDDFERGLDESEGE